MPVSLRPRSTVAFTLGVAVLVVAAVAAGLTVLRVKRIDRTVRVTVRTEGVDEVVEVAASGRISDAFVEAGIAPHNGRLLSAKDRRVLDPRYDPARITMNGQDVADGYPLVDGAVIEAVDGHDAVEATETVEEVIPEPPLRETLVHVYEAGAPGLAERTIGVRSREVVEERVLVEAKPAARTERKVVALTFDDGPNTTWTPLLLDLLKEKKVKATFCQVGDNVDAHPEISERIVKAGHRLCNHTRTHDTGLQSATRERIDEEIGGGVRAFTTEGLPSPDYYRPPGGVLSDLIRDVAWSYDEHVIYWTVDTEDWKGDATIESIVQAVQRDVEPGAIILLHDGGGKSRALSIFATSLIIDLLRAQGYEFTFPYIER